MFIGSISADARVICENILDTLDRSRVTDIYVGCSGNFTFDRIAAAKGFRVRSNDVSLYSALIASAARNEPFECRCVNDELLELFDAWEETPYKPLVEVMFAMRYGAYAARKNDFQRSKAGDYRAGAAQFYEGTVAKFRKDRTLEFEIAEFYFGDFKEHLDRCGDGGAIFLYAPTYKGGYEKMFKYVEESFEYRRAEYAVFDPKTAGEYYLDLLRTKQAVIYSDVKYPETAEYFRGEIVSPGKHPVYFHSSVRNRRTYYISKDEKPIRRTPEILGPDEELGESPEFSIAAVKVALVNHYKHLFMASKVNYSLGGDFALAFLVGGRVFGFAVFTAGLGTVDENEILFLHTDFVVNSKVERLSKLLLYLLRSKDVQRTLSRYYVHRYLGLQTTVYTDKPVSMKYRGPWKKIGENEGGKLRYLAYFTDHGMKECYELWKSRKPMN